MMASKYGHKDIVIQLLNVNVNINQLNNELCSAIMICANYGYVDIFMILVG